MPLTNDGNERDIRIRPDAPPIPLADQDLNGPIPPGDACTTAGTQTDLPLPVPPTPPVEPPPSVTVTTPTSEFNQLYNWADLAGYCPRGLDMTNIEKILFQFLASHFADADRIINPLLKDLIFTADPQTSKIRIVLNTTFDLPTAMRLPAIIIKRGEQKFGRIGLDDRSEGIYAPDIVPFVRRVEGSHTILAVSSVAGQVESLALEITDAFTCVSPVMRSQLPFSDFEVVGVGELQQSDELGTRPVVGVQLSYKYTYGWTMRQTAPVATSVAIPTIVLA